MGTTATIVFARADLTIPGAAEPADAQQEDPGSAEARFFDLIGRSNADVIVLDFSGSSTAEADRIRAIRRKTNIPILVVCNPDPPRMEEYRRCGAADCIMGPIDIIGLNHAIQRIVRVNSDATLLPRSDQQRTATGVEPRRR